MAPFATVTVPGPPKEPPRVVKVPVTLNAPLPWTVPETTRGLAMLWAVLTPRVPWTSSVPVPVTEPALRFRVAADTSRVPEASWIEPVLLAMSSPPLKVAVPVEPGFTTRVPALLRTALVV